MLYDRIKKTVLSNNLIREGEQIGVAVSGGADSVVLANLMQQLSEEMGFSIYLLHYEHGMRGEESLRDMDFVSDMGVAMGLPVVIGRGNVRKAVQATGESPEEAARRLRYAFLETQKQILKLDKIATAHHKQDLAETFLMNLVRGSGIDGLTALRYYRPPGIIRPMLDVSKQEIQKYVEKHNLKYVEDSTNANLEYTRNYIRKEVMPRLEKVNPDVEDAVFRAYGILSEESLALGQYAKQEYDRVVEEFDRRVEIDVPLFNTLPLGMKRRVLRMAIERRFSLVNLQKINVDSIVRLASANKTGKFLQKGDFFARVAYNRLIIADNLFTIVDDGRLEGETPLKEFSDITIQTCARPEEFPPADSHSQFMDASVLENAVVRTRKNGDRFAPMGLKGEKKLKDWFIDKKVPLEERNRAVLVADGNQVLWIVGMALSERAKITDKTKEIVKIQYNI